MSNSGSAFNNLIGGGSCGESSINKTAAVVSVGVVIALALVFIIVKSIRRVYKPLRPRIKKTYVVHKNVTPTPLTCRPTTEQCEITIENCCNMNICDTVSCILSKERSHPTLTCTLSSGSRCSHDGHYLHSRPTHF